MLESDMGVVRNLLYLVQVIGFITNGNRVYYLNRPQPPVVSQAVKAVFDALSTVDKKRDWLEECVPTLADRSRCIVISHMLQRWVVLEVTVRGPAT